MAIPSENAASSWITRGGSGALCGRGTRVLEEEADHFVVSRQRGSLYDRMN